MNKFIKTGLAISLIASSLFMLNGCSQKEEEVLVAEEVIELPEIIEKIEEVEVAEAEVKERIIVTDFESCVTPEPTPEPTPTPEPIQEKKESKKNYSEAAAEAESAPVEEQPVEEVIEEEVISTSFEVIEEQTDAPVEEAAAAQYDAKYFKNRGVIREDGWKWTWYSQKVLPGKGLDIPGRNVDESGYVCDDEGNICLASSTLEKGTVVETPFGKQGKVYDSGCASGTLDVYTNW